MSDHPGRNPDGVGTQGGGGDGGNRAHAMSPCPSPAVVNQQLLPLPHDISNSVSAEAAHAIKIAQIDFARSVSENAAKAYGRIQEVLERHSPE